MYSLISAEHPYLIKWKSPNIHLPFQAPCLKGKGKDFHQQWWGRGWCSTASEWMWDGARNDRRKTTFNKQQQQLEVLRDTDGVEERKRGTQTSLLWPKRSPFLPHWIPSDSFCYFLTLLLLPSDGRSPNQVCFLDVSCNTWQVEHFSAAWYHFHTAWKCLKNQMLLSTRWVCSRATFPP